MYVCVWVCMHCDTLLVTTNERSLMFVNRELVFSVQMYHMDCKNPVIFGDNLLLIDEVGRA